MIYFHSFTFPQFSLVYCNQHHCLSDAALNPHYPQSLETDMDGHGVATPSLSSETQLKTEAQPALLGFPNKSRASSC